MKDILIPFLVLGILGILFAILLSFASRIFHVQVDRRIEKVREILPGANCGACGFPGCDGLANAIIQDGAPINSCPVGGQKVVHALADFLGVHASQESRQVACVMCQGNDEYAVEKFQYRGIRDCRANDQLMGGSKLCPNGCLGCGTCKDVCDFNAIHMIQGIAVVNKENCTACRRCVDICPRNIIQMVDFDQSVMVKCSSHDKGKDVRKYCKVGCIACRICAKQCPDGFTIEDNLASFRYSTDLDSEQIENAVAKCPNKCIHPGLERKESEIKNQKLSS